MPHLAWDMDRLNAMHVPAFSNTPGYINNALPGTQEHTDQVRMTGLTLQALVFWGWVGGVTCPRLGGVVSSWCVL